MNELHLFAGAGGGILGGQLLGHTCFCAVEISDYCREVLLQRQRDGVLPKFPIWDDVKTFDGHPWRGSIDVICGGFPCQDISWAWAGSGLSGERSGLWIEMHRIIKEVQPEYVLIENVGNIRSRGLSTVLDMLHEIGYSTADGDFYGSDCGAPHLRQRTFILARREWTRVVFAFECTECEMCGEPVCPHCHVHYSECACPGPHSDLDSGWRVEDKNWGPIAYRYLPGREEQRGSGTVQAQHLAIECHSWWSAEPDVDRVVSRVANRVDRIRSLGNGQIPGVVALAWTVLMAKYNSEDGINYGSIYKTEAAVPFQGGGV